MRGLDRYEFEIRNGHLYLGNTYSVRRVLGSGSAARISKYDLHGPGQHLDGIENWFYPWQAPH